MSDDVWLCWREDVTEALDYQTTTRDYRQIDRAIRTASRSVEQQLHRTVVPVTATKAFNWPWPEYGRSYVLWLDADELVSVTTLTAGGITIPSTDYYLEPQKSGPPYNRVEINLSTSSAFGGGNTWQRNILITGSWAGSDGATDPAGTITSAITTTTQTTVAVSDASLVGVGAVLVCDSERMIVSGRTWAVTSDTDTLTAVNNDQAVTVADGTTYRVGEVLLIDQERVKVLDIAGNTLTVKRAWDGTTLAAHTGATIYASRSLTVTRGALGSTAATHTVSSALSTVRVPGLVRSLTAAEAILQLQREQAGYTTTHRGKTLGAGGDSSAGSSGGAISTSAIEDMRAAAYSSCARKARTRVI